MAKTKVGKKQGAELCTVNIFFKNNTRTKMFLLNQILFFSEIQQNKFYKIRAKYLNIIRWAEYFHLQEYLVCFLTKNNNKMKSKKYTHSSYQLNTVFTDGYLFTPTELHVSSSCNMTNQPLFFMVQPCCVTNSPWRERESRDTAAQEKSPWGAVRDTLTGQLHGRMEADGQEVCLRLGPMGRDRKSKPHSLFIHQVGLV